MNRIYKLVPVVEVSARSSSVLSMSVRINVITDINIFVQALKQLVSVLGHGHGGRISRTLSRVKSRSWIPSVRRVVCHPPHAASLVYWTVRTPSPSTYSLRRRH